jgi:hypothetical protein
MGDMTEAFLEESVAVLARTPAVVDALLRDLPDAWLLATDGPGTWSPRDVVGHLAYLERTDWMLRLNVILEHGPNRPFDPVDREAQLRNPRPVPELLDEFRALRAENLEKLRGLQLSPSDFEKTGTHPTLGPVTLRNLLATWTAHDMAHLVQIGRTMARRYQNETGPFASFLSVMRK